jgi:hypothetical protein
LETNKENTMKMKIAIFAACACTLALVHTDVARAAYAGATVSKRTVVDGKRVAVE